jgi:hypothetical protein
MFNRPSNKELYNKLRLARQAVEAGRIALINPLALATDAIELGYSIELELNTVLGELLGQTTPAHYAGSKPPQKSYERDIQGLELFAFVVESSRCNGRVYLKFALAEETFWLVSLHKDRPAKEEP